MQLNLDYLTLREELNPLTAKGAKAFDKLRLTQRTAKNTRILYSALFASTLRLSALKKLLI
jgi:hypothetical protein